MSGLDTFVEGLSSTQQKTLHIFKNWVYEVLMTHTLECVKTKAIIKSQELTPVYIFSACGIALMEAMFTVNKALAQHNPVAAQILRARIKEQVHEWSE